MEDNHDDGHELPIIIEGYSKIELTFCKRCRSFLYKGKFLEHKEFKKVFALFLMKHMQFGLEPEELVVDLGVLGDMLDNPAKKKEVRVLAIAEYHGNQIEEEGILEMKTIRQECPLCSRLQGGYYEGIFQLRNRDNAAYDMIMEDIKREVQDRKGVGISKTNQMKVGADMFFTDQKFMNSLASKFHKKYGGELKLSKKLSGFDRSTSKKQYRFSVLLRLPEVQYGDIIEFDKDIFKVVSFAGENVTVESLTRHKSRPIKIIDDYKIVARKKDYIMAQVVKTKPALEVLNPVTFEAMNVENSVLDYSNFEEVEVIMHNEKIYLV